MAFGISTSTKRSFDATEANTTKSSDNVRICTRASLAMLLGGVAHNLQQRFKVLYDSSCMATDASGRDRYRSSARRRRRVHAGYRCGAAFPATRAVRSCVHLHSLWKADERIDDDWRSSAWTIQPAVHAWTPAALRRMLDTRIDVGHKNQTRSLIHFRLHAISVMRVLLKRQFSIRFSTD